MVSRKPRFHYDIGYNNEPLATLWHVVYATLGLPLVIGRAGVYATLSSAVRTQHPYTVQPYSVCRSADESKDQIGSVPERINFEHGHR